MADRKISLLGIHLVHPRRPAPSHVELDIVLDYLKGTPVESIVLTEKDLIRVVEQAVLGLRVLREQREEGRG